MREVPRSIQPIQRGASAALLHVVEVRGNAFLFYRAGREPSADGEIVIEGVECKVWYAGSLGIHPRDLFLLAGLLESPEDTDV